MKVTTKLFVITLVVVLAIAAFADMQRLWGYGDSSGTDRNEVLSRAWQDATDELNTQVATRCPDDGQHHGQDFEHHERCYASPQPDGQSYRYRCHIELSLVCITDH